MPRSPSSSGRQPARAPGQRAAIARRLVGEAREPVPPLRAHAAGLPHHGRPRRLSEATIPTAPPAASGSCWGPAGHTRIPGALVSDHRIDVRRTLELDEEGRIRTTQPLDLIQESRLRRIARPPRPASIGWQLTARLDPAGGRAGGMKPWRDPPMAGGPPGASGASLDDRGHRRLAQGRQEPAPGAGGRRPAARPRRGAVPGDRDEPSPPSLPARPPGSGLARGQARRPQGAGRGARGTRLHP